MILMVELLHLHILKNYTNFMKEFHKLNEGFLAGNKISKRHVQFYKEKMKVVLAAQVLSKSVADALDFLNHDLHISAFKGSEATVKFIRMADSLFDAFNSRNFLGSDLKAPLSPKNIAHFKQLFEEAKIYIRGLKIRKNVTHQNDKEKKGQSYCTKSILSSVNKRGFEGFLVCIESFTDLYQDLVESQNLSYLLTYKFSQDHLEMFFSSLRSKSGWNNNPSVKTLISSYKRLVVNMVFSNKKGANCWPLDCTTVLHCSSSSNKQVILEEIRPSNINILDHDYCEVPFSLKNLSSYVIDIIAYIAGFVVHSISKKTDCNECYNSLFGTVNTSKLLMRKNKGGLKIPSPSVLEICHETEIEIRLTKIKKTLITTNLLQHTINIQRKLNPKIFSSLNKHIYDQEPINNHKDVLIKNIIKKYIITRICHDIKDLNESLHKERIRSQNTKLVLFKNQ